MSLRLLQKQVGADTSETSAAAKNVTQPNRLRGGAGGGRGGYGGSGRGRGAGADAAGRSSSQHEESSSGYYASGSAGGGGGGGCGGGGGGGGGGASVMAPKPGGGFRGSDAQRAHIEAVKESNRKAAAEAPHVATTDVATKSHLGLDAVRERKRKEEEERERKRAEARARRHNEETQKEVEEEKALAECEAQALKDSENGVRYEAALVVRIAVCFGESGAWTKIAEARARGADLPLDPKRIYVLAHPDKCRLPEASDATAILNAQRPPEMTEARPRPKAPAGELSPEDAAREARVAARRAKAAAAREEAAPEVRRAAAAAAAAPAPAAASTEAAERRVDPEDGQVCTFQELQEKYEKTYSSTEIAAYWDDFCEQQRQGKPQPPAPQPEKRTTDSTFVEKEEPAPAFQEQPQPAAAGTGTIKAGGLGFEGRRRRF